MNFISQVETISEMQQDQNKSDLKESSREYISPLASRPSFPVQHYNNETSQNSFKSPPKKQYGGYCDVCKVKLNSYLQSKSHYEGKPHAKMVKRKEEEARQASSGTILPGDEPPNKKARTVPVANLYCGACNLTFTSEVHAKDHYLGRNHARVLHGLAPYTQGYFNTTTNKWQRTPPDPRVSAQLLSSEPPADMEGKPARQDKPKIRGKFHCEICNCSLTCEQQLQSHLAGTKHAKALKKEAGYQAAKDSVTDTMELIRDSAGRATLAAAVESNSGGPFICETCNVSLPGLPELKSHLIGKKHKSRANREYQEEEEEEERGGRVATMASPDGSESSSAAADEQTLPIHRDKGTSCV